MVIFPRLYRPMSLGYISSFIQAYVPWLYFLVYTGLCPLVIFPRLYRPMSLGYISSFIQAYVPWLYFLVYTGLCPLVIFPRLYRPMSLGYISSFIQAYVPWLYFLVYTGLCPLVIFLWDVFLFILIWFTVWFHCLILSNITAYLFIRSMDAHIMLCSCYYANFIFHVAIDRFGKKRIKKKKKQLHRIIFKRDW